MPSPFPGMDPYLEGELWSTFHHEFTTEIKRQLTPKLQPRYYAFTEKFFLYASPEELIIEAVIPDVGIVEQSPVSPPPSGQGVAVAPVQMKIPMLLPVPQVRLAIRDMENRKLVTVIEFLSPTNKEGRGRKQYLRKRRQLLLSSANLVEIDLLRKGKRAPMQEAYPSGHYFILVSRAETRPITDVWPITLEQSLPSVPIPLLEEDPDVFLDLQSAFNNFYDLGGYDHLIDYQKPPDVPLICQEAAWAEQCLRGAGLRP